MAATFEKAVDKAIAAENAAYLAIPEAERDAMAEDHFRHFVATAFLWAVLPGPMAARRDAYLAEMREKVAGEVVIDYVSLAFDAVTEVLDVEADRLTADQARDLFDRVSRHAATMRDTTPGGS